MKVKFQIDYRTQWGQRLYICGSVKGLGEWNENKAFALKPLSIGSWGGEIEIDKENEEFAYKYFIGDEHRNHSEWEFGENRICVINPTRFLTVSVRDFWRSSGDYSSSLLTSPFLNAFFKRNVSRYRSALNKSSNYLKLRLRAPRIGSEYSFGVLGSSNELGKWDEKKVLLMNDEHFPLWQIDVPYQKDSTPLEYKYVIYSNKDEKLVTWEEGANRVLVKQEVEAYQHLIVHTDEAFNYPVGRWKTSGVAIPVFSLRSKRGTGVGEFEDLKLVIDWVNKIGMRVIQVLPVNDTIATHSWQDSYPYAAISVEAIHPIYANLQKIGKLKDINLQNQIDTKRKELNNLNEVDYEAVMDLKSLFFKASYDENKASFLLKDEFKEFFNENESWLKGYAAFSALRDKYGTSDFKKWGKYDKISDQQLSEITAPDHKDYDDIAIHYYIQFHLDKQLKEVSEYARKNGVVLKGDIPIGIFRNSVDAWLKPKLFKMESQAGAPPDEFSSSGQNWGFPTYKWDVMEKNGFKWWSDRLVKMSKYFDIFRIDHILGFFRIWEIPWESVEGIMGSFNPSLPVSLHEFEEKGIQFDYNRYCKCYIKTHVIHNIFSSHAEMVMSEYLEEISENSYQFKKTFDTQRKVKDYFDKLIIKEPERVDYHNWLKNGLFQLHSEVLFFEVPNQAQYIPRIAFHSTHSYQDLNDEIKGKLNQIYSDFFYHRHNDFWREGAMKKLAAIKKATGMLICGEDLGMVPASVPGVMDELGILSLAVQRMPNDDKEFWHPNDTPYMSVTTTSTHDISTLREWWNEDRGQTQRFFNNILNKSGEAPDHLESWVASCLIMQHLKSPSMLAILPIQDLLAMDESLRRADPAEERINIPANPNHYWRYRLHIPIENLLRAKTFNDDLLQMIDEGGRKSDY